MVSECCVVTRRNLHPALDPNYATMDGPYITVPLKQGPAAVHTTGQHTIPRGFNAKRLFCVKSKNEQKRREASREALKF